MTYKPFPDLEIDAIIPEFGATLLDVERLKEQARRANRLAAAARLIEVTPLMDIHIAAEELREARVSYLGET